MYIDVHSHLNPPEFQVGIRPSNMFDVGPLLARHERAGVVTVVSNPMFSVRPDLLELTTLDNIKRYNSYVAELQSRHPVELIGSASAMPFGGDDHLQETERAIKEYKLKAVMINSSVRGEYLDSPRAHAFYQLVTELDVPVIVHPPAATAGAEHMTGPDGKERYRLTEMVGRPFDTTLSLARVVYSGVLEKFPALKLIGLHVGGAITMLAGRLDYGWELRHDPNFLPFGSVWGDDVLSQPPSAYIRRLYLDSMCFHAPALRCAIETVGIDHVVFGTDFPPVGMPIERSIQVIDDLGLNETDREKIARGNARGLLGL